MLKTNKSAKNLLLLLIDEDDKVGSNEGNCKDKIIKRLSSTSKNLDKAIGYLILKARVAFNKAPILWHFDLECYIWIKTNVSGYAIIKVISQLILDNLSQWNPVA